AETSGSLAAYLPVPAIRADEKRHIRQATSARLEEARGALRGRQAEVIVGPLGEDAAARGALQQALLKQVGLEHVLDRVLLLADRDRQSREADRAAGELGRHRV